MKLKQILFSLLILSFSFTVACGGVGGTGGNEPLVFADGLTDVIYVRTSAFGDGTGSSWENATDNLQQAINDVSAASDKTHVFILAGTYKPTLAANTITGGTAAQQVHFSLRNNVTVIGGFKGNEVDYEPSLPSSATVLSGDLADNDTEDEDGNFLNRDDNAYHVFYHPDGTSLNNTAKLYNVTITGGYADGGGHHNGGGGMFNYRNSPIVSNCGFNKNTAIGQSGGGCGRWWNVQFY